MGIWGKLLFYLKNFKGEYKLFKNENIKYKQSKFEFISIIFG